MVYTAHHINSIKLNSTVFILRKVNEFLDILKHRKVISLLFIISLFEVLSTDQANKFVNVILLFLRILHFSLHFTCLFDSCFSHFPPGDK